MTVCWKANIQRRKEIRKEKSEAAERKIQENMGKKRIAEEADERKRKDTLENKRIAVTPMTSHDHPKKMIDYVGTMSRHHKKVRDSNESLVTRCEMHIFSVCA